MWRLHHHRDSFKPCTSYDFEPPLNELSEVVRISGLTLRSVPKIHSAANESITLLFVRILLVSSLRKDHRHGDGADNKGCDVLAEFLTPTEFEILELAIRVLVNYVRELGGIVRSQAT